MQINRFRALRSSLMYCEWCTNRCLRNLQAVNIAFEHQSENPSTTCIAKSIGLVEMAARSPFETFIENLIFRVGLWTALAGVVPGVPDISVGPFQIRPSTAFQWRRVRTKVGHLACPPRNEKIACVQQCRELLAPDSAAPHLLAILKRLEGAHTSCISLVDAFERFRGSRLSSPHEADLAVLLRVHNSLHATSFVR